MTLSNRHLLIVDVEATCWKGNPPPGEQNEIIEIGICVFDLSTRKPAGKRSILVKPMRSKVSLFCTKLTTLIQAQVDQGIHFAEACAILENEFLSQSRPWASWGNYDAQMFAKQCASFAVPYPFSDQHTNLKRLFADANGLQRQVGMARALDMSGITLEGTHHRGDDDARNIGRLLQELLRTHGDGMMPEFWKDS